MRYFLLIFATIVCFCSAALVPRASYGSSYETSKLQKIEAFVEREYSNDWDERKITAVTNNLKSNQNFLRAITPSVLRNQVNFKNLTVPYIKKYEKWFDPQTDLWNRFKSKALQWYPHMSEFFDHFTFKFMWRQQLFEYKIKDLTKDGKEFESKITPYLSDYVNVNTSNKESVNAAINKHIRDIMKIDLKLTGSKIETALNQFVKAKRTEIYDVKYLFQRQKLKEMISGVIKTPCLRTVEAGWMELLKFKDAEKLEAAKKHFRYNTCFGPEICASQPSLNARNLQNELEPYIAWFGIVYEGEQLDNNENLKDEMDETVYNTIDKLLLKDFNDQKRKCIIDYMKRTRSVDKVYNVEMLFNEDLIKSKIMPIVNKYNEKYEINRE